MAEGGAQPPATFSAPAGLICAPSSGADPSSPIAIMSVIFKTATTNASSPDITSAVGGAYTLSRPRLPDADPASASRLLLTSLSLLSNRHHSGPNVWYSALGLTVCCSRSYGSRLLSKLTVMYSPVSPLMYLSLGSRLGTLSLVVSEHTANSEQNNNNEITKMLCLAHKYNTI